LPFEAAMGELAKIPAVRQHAWRMALLPDPASGVGGYLSSALASFERGVQRQSSAP